MVQIIFKWIYLNGPTNGGFHLFPCLACGSKAYERPLHHSYSSLNGGGKQSTKSKEEVYQMIPETIHLL